MKSRFASERQVNPDSELPLHCDVILSCLTGTSAAMSLRQFYHLWKQMLPESNCTLPAAYPDTPVAGSPISGSSFDLFPPTAFGNIREKPD